MTTAGRPATRRDAPSGKGDAESRPLARPSPSLPSSSFFFVSGSAARRLGWCRGARPDALPPSGDPELTDGLPAVPSPRVRDVASLGLYFYFPVPSAFPFTPALEASSSLAETPAGNGTRRNFAEGLLFLFFFFLSFFFFLPEQRLRRWSMDDSRFQNNLLATF